MKVIFEKPVVFSTIDFSFTGDGIPPIPADAASLKVGDHVVAYVSANGEVWECFIGAGTAETSQTYYWPALGMCPRAWAESLKN